MILLALLACLLSSAGVEITEPEDEGVYSGDWLTVRAIVENENLIPDSVVYSLNGQPGQPIPRLVTDWYTYMANDHHTGHSESPAPLDNSVLWSAAITGDTHEFCSPVIVDGRVYFVSDQQSIAYALDAATGEVIWQYDVQDHVDDAVTWHDGKVYVAADSAWCLDAVSGERIWSFKPSPSLKMNGTPALAPGVAYFSFAPDYGSLQVFALESETGEEIWKRDIPHYSTGCLTLSGNRLYVPTCGGPLYALETGSGSTVWENTDAATGYWDSSPVLVDGVIYICGMDGVARGIDAVFGSTIWERDISSGIRYIAATPAYHDGRIYFADQVDTFHCLEALDGEVVWGVPGVQHGSPGIADGVVFFGEGADRDLGQVRALSCDSGAEIWSYQTGGGQIYSSPAITDGVVYIAGMDWNLYAFGTELRFTYLDDLYASIGPNELIVTSWSGGLAAAADTVSFSVTATGTSTSPSPLLGACVFPNPAVESASISFSLIEPGPLAVEVLDLSGRLVRVLVEVDFSAGNHVTEWDLRDMHGAQVPSGIYFFVVRSGELREAASFCLLR